MDKLEAFINAQTDMDWTWGGFARYRPPKHVTMDLKYWAVSSLLYALTGVIVSGISLWIIEIFQSRTQWYSAVMSGRLSFWAVCQSYWLWTWHDHAWLIMIVMPIVGVLFWLPYVYFWNRRAARLRQMPPVDEEPIPQAGVWPPPPKRVS